MLAQQEARVLDMEKAAMAAALQLAARRCASVLCVTHRAVWQL